MSLETGLDQLIPTYYHTKMYRYFPQITFNKVYGDIEGYLENISCGDNIQGTYIVHGFTNEVLVLWFIGYRVMVQLVF